MVRVLPIGFTFIIMQLWYCKSCYRTYIHTHTNPILVEKKIDISCHFSKATTCGHFYSQVAGMCNKLTEYSLRIRDMDSKDGEIKVPKWRAHIT